MSKPPDPKHDDTKGAKPPESTPPKALTREEVASDLTKLAGIGAAIARSAKRGLERLRDEPDVDVRELHDDALGALNAQIEALKAR